MSSCFGLRRKRPSSEDREPLLPQYQDDTVLQRELHQKLHSYQMVRALGKGYMPSNEQLVIHLRTLLAADILNPSEADLSESGRLLVKYTKLWLEQFIALLQHKNDKDQIQDFVWSLSGARVSLDVADFSQRAVRAKNRADTAAGMCRRILPRGRPQGTWLTSTTAYQSLQTVGSLLLTNSDFRIFLSDLGVTAKEVFRDTAFSISKTAEVAGKKLDPSAEQKQQVQKPGNDAGHAPTSQEVTKDAQEITQTVVEGAVTVTQDTAQSAADKLTGTEGEVMINRLKQAIFKLRKRPDYSDSVSTLAKLLQRYAMTYSRAVEQTLEQADRDINENAELDKAVANFWSFVKSFGEPSEWEALEACWQRLLSHKDSDPEFEKLATETGNSLQALLTDPDFLEQAPEKFQELKEKSKQTGSESSLRQDIDALMVQAQSTLHSVTHDQDIARLLRTSLHIMSIFSPTSAFSTADLIQDGINTFIPLAIAAVQHLPIPRLEVSTPEIDLLLENLIIEPGKTVNGSSFLPYKLRVETYNDVEIRKAKFRTTSTSSHLMTIKLDGLSARAEEVGFWLRAHSGIFRLADEGIASFALDERGMDIHLDIEIAKDRLESLVSLKDVRVHIHKLDYQMRKSKFSWLGWLVKPFLRPVVRKVMERQLATAIGDAIHFLNREALYARERLRATRIADPDDLMTFFRAVAARLSPEEDPDLYTRVGVAQPGKGVFKGVYAPGSVVKLWNEEAVRAPERIEENDQGGKAWNNEIFDLHVRSMG